MKRILLEETSSTNDYIRQFLEEGEDVVVCARRQSAGRGTKGRSFLSEEGGVYLSKLTFYKNLPAGEAFRVMTHAAVAVCRTAERFGARPELKWPNDVLAERKKLAGILIENILEGDRVKASVVGIGLNVSNPLTGLEDIAVRLKELSSLPPSAEEVRDALIWELGRESSFSDYLSYVRFLGRTVSVTEGERQYTAVARELLPDGRLLVTAAGERRLLSAAEISIGW